METALKDNSRLNREFIATFLIVFYLFILLFYESAVSFLYTGHTHHTNTGANRLNDKIKLFFWDRLTVKYTKYIYRTRSVDCRSRYI